MDSPAPFGFQELFHQLIGEMAKSISKREAQTPEQEFSRFRAATHCIMAFLPRDAIEAMLAGQCVMLHEMIVDSTGETLRGETSPARRAARGNIVAMLRCFGSTLAALERYQARRAEGRRDAPDARDEKPAETAVAETEIEDRVHRQEATKPAAPPQPPRETPHAAAQPIRPGSNDKGQYQPSRAAIAACRANPAALRALDAGDAAGFAQAMGIARPSEDYLAAAATHPASPFLRLDTGRAAGGGTEPKAQNTAPRDKAMPPVLQSA